MLCTRLENVCDIPLEVKKVELFLNPMVLQRQRQAVNAKVQTSNKNNASVSAVTPVTSIEGVASTLEAPPSFDSSRHLVSRTVEDVLRRGAQYSLPIMVQINEIVPSSAVRFFGYAKVTYARAAADYDDDGDGDAGDAGDVHDNDHVINNNNNGSSSSSRSGENAPTSTWLVPLSSCPLATSPPISVQVSHPLSTTLGDAVTVDVILHNSTNIPFSLHVAVDQNAPSLQPPPASVVQAVLSRSPLPAAAPVCISPRMVVTGDVVSTFWLPPHQSYTYSLQLIPLQVGRSEIPFIAVTLFAPAYSTIASLSDVEDGVTDHASSFLPMKTLLTRPSDFGSLFVAPVRVDAGDVRPEAEWRGPNNDVDTLTLELAG